MNTADRLNMLLCGELAATETYQQAIAKMAGTPLEADLRRIHVEHRTAANVLRQHIHLYDGKPIQSSGAWGAWAQLVEGASEVFGNAGVLTALETGELEGVSDYETALLDEELSGECKTLINTQLLPQTNEHVEALERMLSAA